MGGVAQEAGSGAHTLLRGALYRCDGGRLLPQSPDPISPFVLFLLGATGTFD